MKNTNVTQLQDTKFSTVTTDLKTRPGEFNKKEMTQQVSCGSGDILLINQHQHQQALMCQRHAVCLLATRWCCASLVFTPVDSLACGRRHLATLMTNRQQLSYQKNLSFPSYNYNPVRFTYTELVITIILTALEGTAGAGSLSDQLTWCRWTRSLKAAAVPGPLLPLLIISAGEQLVG